VLGAFGAAGKTKPADLSERDRLTRRQAVKVVQEAIPAEVLAKIPKQGPLVAAAAKSLADRSPEQVVQRARTRWVEHWHRERWTRGEVESPMGLAVSLLQHGDCTDVRCDDGVNVDSGQDCPRCVERAAAFRRERGRLRSVPAARAADEDQAAELPRRVPLAQLPKCVDCSQPTHEPTASGRCPTCEGYWREELASWEVPTGEDPAGA
jgi:hypothetical protein